MNHNQLRIVSWCSMVVWALAVFTPGPVSAETHLSNIRLRMESPAIVSPDQRIYMDYDFSTTETPHMFVFARPMFEGQPVGTYNFMGSTYNSGTGSSHYWFKISEGSQFDSILLYAVDASYNIILDKVIIPFVVECRPFGAVITGYSAPQPSAFHHTEELTVNMEYNVTVPGGVRVGVRPVSDGALTPSYAADGYFLVEGEGTLSPGFRITSGENVHVDHLQVRFYDETVSIVLAEYYVPVDFYWSSAGLVPTLMTLDHANGRVWYNCHYTTDTDIRIVGSPTSDDPIALWGWSGMATQTGSGDVHQWVSILDPEYGNVTGVNLRVLEQPGNAELLNFVFPLDPPVFSKGTSYFTNVRISPTANGEIQFRQPVLIEYDWYSSYTGEKYVIVQPVVESGAVSYSYYQDLGLFGDSGDGSTCFYLTTNDVFRIVGVRLWMKRTSDSINLAMKTYPVEITNMPANAHVIQVDCPTGDDVNLLCTLPPHTTWRLEESPDLLSWPTWSAWDVSYGDTVFRSDPDAMIHHDQRYYRIRLYDSVDWPNR